MSTPRNPITRRGTPRLKPGPRSKIPEDFGLTAPRPKRRSLAERLQELVAKLPPIDQRRCPHCRGVVTVAYETVEAHEVLYGSCLLCGREVDLECWAGPLHWVA